MWGDQYGTRHPGVTNNGHYGTLIRNPGRACATHRDNTYAGIMSHLLGAWNNVRGLERLSLCDWPGRTSCVLFMGGCNLQCPTCHNGSMAWRPERHPAIGRERIMSYLEKRKMWLDGVTITGGEPSLTGGISELLTDISQIGLPVKMDSNGMRPHVLADLLDQSLVDTFAVDVKGPFDKYPALTGGAVTVEQAANNLDEVFKLADRHPDSFYFRITKVPILDDQDIKDAHKIVPSGFKLIEQAYVPPGRTQNAETDPEKGRMSGNVVAEPNRGRNPQSAESKRRTRPDSIKTPST